MSQDATLRGRSCLGPHHRDADGVSPQPGQSSLGGLGDRGAFVLRLLCHICATRCSEKPLENN